MMNCLEKTFAPPHSIIFISDPTQQYEVPIDTGVALVTATSSCICVGTLAEMNGPTTVKLAATVELPVGQLVFDGKLETPGLRIAVSDSGTEVILSMVVQRRITHVKVWANDPNEPDRIIVEAA